MGVVVARRVGQGMGAVQKAGVAQAAYSVVAQLVAVATTAVIVAEDSWVVEETVVVVKEVAMVVATGEGTAAAPRWAENLGGSK